MVSLALSGRVAIGQRVVLGRVARIGGGELEVAVTVG